jgi:hypothetical protein
VPPEDGQELGPKHLVQRVGIKYYIIIIIIIVII